MFLKPAYRETAYDFRMPRIGSEMLWLHSVKCWKCINSLGCFRYVQNVLYNQAFCLCQTSFVLDQVWSVLLPAESIKPAYVLYCILRPHVNVGGPELCDAFRMTLAFQRCLGRWPGGKRAALGVVCLKVWRKGKVPNCNYSSGIKI